MTLSKDIRGFFDLCLSRKLSEKVKDIPGRGNGIGKGLEMGKGVCVQRGWQGQKQSLDQELGLAGGPHILGQGGILPQSLSSS